MFPNPAKDRVSVETSLEGESELTLFDGLGNLVLKKTFRQTTDLLTNNLPKAVYTYRVSNGQGAATGKLLLK